MHQLVYLLANLAVGGAGSWPGVADPSAFPAAMTVDYIRVYLNDVTTLYGTSGPDLLAGGGGANTLIGRTGDDSYLVDNVGDGVIENAGEGTDTFFSTVHVRLSANVEHLVLQGSADLQGYGNASADTLRNAGNNLLNGGGADVLVGNAGNDAFVFQRGRATATPSRISPAMGRAQETGYFSSAMARARPIPMLTPPIGR